MKFVCDVRLLRGLVSAIEKINAEPTMVVEGAGINILAMDVSRSYMIHLGVKKESFDYYEVGDVGEVCFSFSDVASLLRGMGGVVTLEVVENKVRIEHLGDYAYKTFEVPLLEGKPLDLVPSDLPHTSFCKVSVSSLLECIRDAERVKSEYVQFAVVDGFLVFKAQGDRADVVSKLRSLSAVLDSDLTEGDYVLLDRDHLKLLLNSGSVFTDVVKLSFAIDVPIELDFQVPFEGVCRAWLSPCILPEEGEK